MRPRASLTAARQASLLADSIKPVLAGKSPETQGGALAVLLATWLAGHIVRSNPSETAALRQKLLDEHNAAVRALIPLCEQEIKSRL